MKPASMRKAWVRFRQHRNSSRSRRIPFRLDFAMWLAIWVYSGFWSKRGVGRGTYCMSRRGDQGAYEVANIAIVPNAVNSSEAYAKRGPVVITPAQRAETSRRSTGNTYALGHVVTDEMRQRMRDGCKRRRETAWLQNVRGAARRRAEVSP
jgi:hypothetical protein